MYVGVTAHNLICASDMDVHCIIRQRRSKKIVNLKIYSEKKNCTAFLNWKKKFLEIYNWKKKKFHNFIVTTPPSQDLMVHP